jgi:ribosomal protein S14
MGSTLPASAAKALVSGPGRDARMVASASCCSCGRPIADWRERLLPIRSGELVGTESGDLAVRVEHKAGCMHCGEERAEIRVEETARYAMRGQFEEE